MKGTMDNKSIIAATAAAKTIQWGTHAPFSLGDVWVDRIGFASIPVVGCTVYHRRQDNITAVVRQHVYQQLQARGMPYNHEVIKLTPSVGFRSRKRKIVDKNPSSESYGKNKMLHEADYTFEIIDIKRWAACVKPLDFGRKPLDHYGKVTQAEESGS